MRDSCFPGGIVKTDPNRKKTKRLCYLCGKPGANTKDHIPPRDIFPQKPTGQLITVPAHYDCNHSFHKEDELFRNLITVASTRTPQGSRAWKEQVVPSWQKNRGAKRDLQKRLTSVWVKEAITGAFVRKPGVKLEVELVERQIDRWTRGLFYHKFKGPMPPDLKVEVDRLNPPEQSLIPFLKELAKERVRPIWVHVEPNVFTYTYLTTYDSKHMGIAIFVFFNTEVFVGTTGIDRIGLSE